MARRARADAIIAEKARRSENTATLPQAAAARQQRMAPIAMLVGVLLLAAIVGSSYWVRFHTTFAASQSQHSPAFSEDTAATVAEAVARPVVDQRPAVPATVVTERPAAQSKEHASPAIALDQDRKAAMIATPERSTPVRPKPAAPANPPRRTTTPAPATKPVRAVDTKRETPAAAPVLAAAPVVAPPVVPVAEAATPPAAPAVAVCPFFETRDVNETPRIATRAEPRFPAALKGRAHKEVVVVRALVSQNGHPSRVSLLRRSKGGPEVDEVILDSVNQWTFSPARKKGEAVSCWFNFAIEVGAAE